MYHNNHHNLSSKSLAHRNHFCTSFIQIKLIFHLVDKKRYFILFSHTIDYKITILILLGIGRSPLNYSIHKKLKNIASNPRIYPCLHLQCPRGHRCSLSPKFQFYFKKGSSKKFSYDRRAYESVDEKSQS